jgi:FSR family fosmidomycin resistance protein-like MFS transporter
MSVNGATEKELAVGHLVENGAMAVLVALSACHFMNDVVASLLPAAYPMFKVWFNLSFAKIGLITSAYQITASVLQPLVGFYTDRKPRPYSLAIGMGFTLVGLVGLGHAPNFPLLLASIALVGVGSSVFHPEASRLARLTSGGRHGFAQSLFQMGGSLGSAVGPLLAALIVLRHGQASLTWFGAVTLSSIMVLIYLGAWQVRTGLAAFQRRAPRARTTEQASPRRIGFVMTILLALIFSKYFYLSSLTNYYTFYLIDKFHLSIAAAQIYLFVFLGSVAAGTFIGGPLGDRFGRKYVIWGSILGVLPFTLVLPYVGLGWTVALSVPIGLILSSAFSAIVVYGQELMPGKVGAVSGLFFGLAFGMSGIGAAALGRLADVTSISTVYHVCSFLPAIGLLAVFLPDIETQRQRKAA